MIPEDDYEPIEQRQAFDFRARDNATPAHVAAKFGDLQHLQELVEVSDEQGRRLLLTASDRNGWQPLHEACRGGHRNIVRYLVTELIEHIDVHATTNSGATPLSLSQEYHGQNHPVTRLLQQISESENDSS